MIILCRHCEFVEVHDEMGEWMNIDVVTNDNIDDGNFEPNAANNDLNKEWGLKDFVPDEEIKDELWD